MASAIRNIMRTSIWSSTIPKIRSSNLHSHLLSVTSVHSSICLMEIHGKYTRCNGPKPFDFTRSWKVHNMAYSCTLRLRNTSTTYSIFPNAKHVVGYAHYSSVSLCIHIPLCWVLVYKTGLKNIGAAISMDIAMWLNVTFLFFYMKYSPSCEKTRAPISMEALHGMKQFFSFAIPSAVMICLEWWSYEFLILLSGLLPNPELETSVLSVCLNTIATLYAIAYGFGAGISTMVSNELGAGNPQRACVAVHVVLIAIVETSIVSTSVFVSRHVFGYIFTNEKEVVDYFTKMAPLLCLNILMDSLQGTLSGVVRGVGWQHLGAYINLAAFYLVGIPVAAKLGFCTSLRGVGLWIGILVGAFIQLTLLSTIAICTNYEKQAVKVRQRLFEEESLSEGLSVPISNIKSTSLLS